MSFMRSVTGKNITGRLMAIALLLCAAGCAHRRPDLPPYSGRQEIATLSSSVSTSLHAGESSFSGNGHLLYRIPDSFRLVLLSPFGTAAMDFYLSGSDVTIVIPPQKTAYHGSIDEIPSRAGADSWRLLRWALFGDPFRIAAGPACITGSVAPMGSATACYDVDGLLTEKSTDNGDRISYGSYAVVDAVTFPLKVTIRDRNGGEAVIGFDEPELNRPLEDGAFTPELHEMTPLPLGGFTGR